jgi:hypothetical protein
MDYNDKGWFARRKARKEYEARDARQQAELRQEQEDALRAAGFHDGKDTLMLEIVDALEHLQQLMREDNKSRITKIILKNCSMYLQVGPELQPVEIRARTQLCNAIKTWLKGCPFETTPEATSAYVDSNFPYLIVFVMMQYMVLTQVKWQFDYANPRNFVEDEFRWAAAEYGYVPYTLPEFIAEKYKAYKDKFTSFKDFFYNPFWPKYDMDASRKTRYVYDTTDVSDTLLATRTRPAFGGRSSASKGRAKPRRRSRSPAASRGRKPTPRRSRSRSRN